MYHQSAYSKSASEAAVAFSADPEDTYGQPLDRKLLRQLSELSEKTGALTDRIERVPHLSALLLENLSIRNRSHMDNSELMIELHCDLFDAALKFKVAMFKIYVGLKETLEKELNRLLFQKQGVVDAEELKQWSIDQKYKALVDVSGYLHDLLPRIRKHIAAQDIVGLVNTLLDKLIVAGIIDLVMLRDFEVASAKVDAKSMAKLFKYVESMANIVDDIGLLRVFMRDKVEIREVYSMLFGRVMASRPSAFIPPMFAADENLCREYFIACLRQSSKRTAERIDSKTDAKLMEHIDDTARSLHNDNIKLMNDPATLERLAAMMGADASQIAPPAAVNAAAHVP